jgi:hypothetical protein
VGIAISYGIILLLQKMSIVMVWICSKGYPIVAIKKAQAFFIALRF